MIFPKFQIPASRFKILLAIILLFSFATRVYKLGEPPKDYFDENMAACISMVSFIVNKNLLDMHIIIRSEIDSKFKNDIWKRED